MKEKLYKIGVFAVAGVLLLAVPAASEDRPEDDPPTADDDGGAESGDGVTTEGTQVDDFVNVNNSDGNGLTRVNLNSESACCTDAWRLVNNSDAANRFELREGADVLRMVMEQDSGDLGLGTDSPSNRLHIRDSGGFQVNLDDGGGNEYIQDAFGSSFRIGHTNTRRQFRIFGDDAPNNALNVRDGVGIGTTSPAGGLHVTGIGGAPADALVVSGTGVGIGTASPVQDLEIHNIDGDALTAFQLNNAGERWNNGVQAPGGGGSYVFSKIGTGGNEFLARERNHGTATVDVEGPVRATEFKTVSSREFKTDEQPVDTVDALNKLNQLDVKSWRFKECRPGEGHIEGDSGETSPCTGPGTGPRHVGPMAEDFNQAFGLDQDDDIPSISLVDANGVLVAAVQGLTQELEEKEQALQGLSTELEEKDEALSDLESKVSALEERLDEALAQGGNEVGAGASR